MGDTDGADERERRIIKLGDLVAPEPEAYLTIRYDRKTARGDRAASVTIADVSEAQGEGRAPTGLLIARSKVNEGELVGVPCSAKAPDALEMVWSNQGRYVLIKTARLLAFRRITIPEGTRMFISLYKTEDPEFGKVVGIRINSATYRSIDYMSDEEKAARAEKRKRM